MPPSNPTQTTPFPTHTHTHIHFLILYIATMCIIIYYYTNFSPILPLSAVIFLVRKLWYIALT